MSLLNFYSILAANNYILGHSTENIVSVLNSCGIVRQLTILYSPEMEIQAGNIVSSLKIPVLLNVRQDPSREIRVVGDPNNIVLVLNDEMTVVDILNSTLRYHSTIYVIIVNSHEEVESRLKEFWSEFVISVYVLLINETSGYELYGFDPQPNGISVKNVQSLEAVQIFDGHGTLANVSVVDIPPAVVLQPNESDLEGFEGRIIKEVIRKFNLTGNYAKPTDGELWGWAKPTPAGVLGEVYTDYSTFGFGILAATYERTQLFDQIEGYSLMECNTWAVPKGAGEAAPIWISMLLTEYAWDAWLGLIVSSVAILIAYAIIDGTGIVHALFCIFAVSIGAPVHLSCKTASRILTVVWVWASFIIAVAYQASMGSKLAVPPVKPDIDTYADLLDSDLEFLSLRNPIGLMTDDHPEIHALKLRTSHSDLSLETLLERIATKRDLAYMRQRTTFRYPKMFFALLRSGNDQSYRNILSWESYHKYYAAQHPLAVDKLHITSSCAFKYQHTINMRRWSPFFQGARKIVQWLMEFGLIAKWEKDFMPEYHSLSKPTEALGMNHLKGVFIMLTVGYGISAIAFVIEVLWHKSCKRFHSLLRVIRKCKLQRIKNDGIEA